MYLGSDAIALAPFTDAISYLEDGDWAVLTRKGVEVRDDQRPQGRAADVIKSTPRRILVDKGNHQPFHGQGNPRAARGRRPHARALPRHGRTSASRCRRSCRSIAASSSGFRSRPAAPPTMPAWWRNIGSSASRDCRSKSISRPNSAIARRRSSRRSGDFRLAVGRDRRHAGDVALRQGAQAAHALGRQCADLDHRARKRRGDADVGRAGNRRCLDQGVHLPARGACLSCGRRRPRARRCCPRRTSRSSCAR